MKIRYEVRNNVIIGIDGGFFAEEYYLTDETLQCVNSDGAYQYKIVNGSHALRTQQEINTDVNFIAEYRLKKLEHLKELIKNNWLDINRTVEEMKAKIAEVKGMTLNTKVKIDNAYSAAVTWLGL